MLLFKEYESQYDLIAPSCRIFIQLLPKQLHEMIYPIVFTKLINLGSTLESFCNDR